MEVQLCYMCGGANIEVIASQLAPSHLHRGAPYCTTTPKIANCHRMGDAMHGRRGVTVRLFTELIRDLQCQWVHASFFSGKLGQSAVGFAMAALHPFPRSTGLATFPRASRRVEGMGCTARRLLRGSARS